MRYGRLKRVGRASAPLLILISCLAIINVTSRLSPDTTAERPSPTRMPAVTDSQTSSAVTDLGTPTPTQAVPPSPEPTPESQPATASTTPIPVPTLPPDSAIRLLGPPDGSTFNRDNLISLYWGWPYPLPEDAYFEVLIYSDDQALTLEPIFEPNLGSTFHVRLTSEQIAKGGATLQWQVSLRTALAASPLLESEIRSIRLFSQP